MGKLRVLFLAAVAAVMGACSGGSDNSIVSPPSNNPGGNADVASLTLLTSSPQMPSDGSADATITALVRDANNNVMSDVSVILSASSGSLATAGTVTDDNGIVTATLSTAGDPTNRAITVNGTAGDGVNATVTVNVVGTTLLINGPTSLPTGSTGDYNVVLSNAGGTGIGNTQVTITSDNGNGISATPITTDALGRASFTLTANSSGTDTLTASALGLDATLDVAVSGDSFSFTSPASGTEINLGVNQAVSVLWQQNGAGVSARPVNFAATRGTLSAAQVNTDGTGAASVTIVSNNAGPAVITATNDDGTSVQLPIEFVATMPTTLELQADPFTVATNDQSAITAIVRDVDGNLVKNQQVNFVLTDNTGGSLSVAQATTNSQGRAQTFYNATNTTSAVDGVRIDATVASTPSVTDFVRLTVAQREVFISLGTGNEIEEPNTAQYLKEWIVQVTDAQGNGVDDVDVSLSVLSERYWDGMRVAGANGWDTVVGPNAGEASSTHPLGGCDDEDQNRNGVLDATPTNEDYNGSTRIEAGNIASVAAQTGGGTVTTDENGFALVNVFWPQEYAYYLEVTLEARTAVQGTEFAESTTFVLQGSADDFNDLDSAPPGPLSPFGTDFLCETPPPPLGP